MVNGSGSIDAAVSFSGLTDGNGHQSPAREDSPLQPATAAGYMKQQAPGAQIMCAVRSSAIVLPKDTASFRSREGFAGSAQLWVLH